jgi:hypothetical protein
LTVGAVRRRVTGLTLHQPKELVRGCRKIWTRLCQAEDRNKREKHRAKSMETHFERVFKVQTAETSQRMNDTENSIECDGGKSVRVKKKISTGTNCLYKSSNK